MNSTPSIRIEKRILLPAWDEKTQRNVISFWQKRGVTFTEAEGETLQGWRGSLWGNMTSFDMGKLRAHLTVSRTGPTEIECVLDVDTSYQDITEWNEAYWHLEIDTLESYLLRGDLREDEWRQFQRDSRAAAWQWTLSLTQRGRKMPPKP